MSPRLDNRWPEIDVLLDGVLEQPADRRQEWLRQHCKDEELQALVQSLLAADSIHGAAIQAQADAMHGWLDVHAGALPDVPGYRMIRLLGEGGMASVFLAERVLGGTVQRVALKRLRLSVYDPRERHRFEHEHGILARLEHPNIARLIDAGIAPDGVPWFAMEYVEGEPLIAWCDARKLGTDARLSLFHDICAAVQYAHQHLIVHRDLKPSNILVDEDGRVKLLDFGIAYLLDPETVGRDPTRTEHRRLTPGYAAPEQYLGHASTTTDVYALGVILVELLSGQRPAIDSGLGSDPLRGLTVTGEAAGVRSTSARTLMRLLSSDLGAIARKAMRSDPALRYGSVQAMAEDMAALRAGRPVTARRGDWRYRAACFARRNKAGVAAAAVVTAILIGATAVSLRQAQMAREQAQRAQAVQAFIEDMLAPLRSGVPNARMPRLDELLAMGVRRLDRDGGRDPEVYSELLLMLARTYESMGDIDTARTLAQRSYAHSLRAFGSDDPRTVEALAMRGHMQAVFGDYAQARRDVQLAWEQMRDNGTRGAALAGVLDEIGALHLQERRDKQATTLFEEARNERVSVLGPEHPDIALSYENLAGVAEVQGDRPKALALFQRAYRHCAMYEGAHTLKAATFLGRVGLTMCELGRWRDGAQHYRDALAVLDQLEQRDHPERFHILDGGCTAWVFLDELERAKGDCDQAVAMAARLFGKGSREHGRARSHRLKLLAAQGKLREAHAEAEDLYAKLDGESTPHARIALDRSLSDTLTIEGDYRRLRDGMLAGVANRAWANAPIGPALFARLALACWRAPDARCPADLVARTDARMAEPSHRDHPLRIEALLPLARLALEQGDIPQAHRRLDEIVRLSALPQAPLKPDHRWLAEARMLRGDALAAQGDASGARREWQAAEGVFAARYSPEHPLRRQLASRLARFATLKEQPTPSAWR